jgi:threonylcarbamoyladenosine tRNA methylthiotransferase MtaB
MGRGKSRSTSAQIILEKIRSFIEGGFKEIVLTGVDITSWGKDFEREECLGDLVSLILEKNQDLDRLRLSSLDISEIDNKLIRLYETENRLMPHLHLSLQSGNNMILKRMKRRHSRETTINLCKKLKASRPELTFGADLIAGFPTENQEMFDDTFNLIKECDITWLHIFPYSSRQGTPASRMPQVEKQKVLSRAQSLRKLALERKKRHFAKFHNKTISVLMETEHKGRSEDFAEIKVSNPLLPGKIYKLTVNGYDDETLLGFV